MSMVINRNCFNHSTTQIRVTVMAQSSVPSAGHNFGIVASEQKFKEVVLSEILTQHV